MPQLSIVIPTLNEEQFLPKLLAEIKAQKFQDFEIIVADAGSSDNTAEIASEHGAKVVEGGLPGLGRNSGAKHAAADIIMFMDSDVSFDQNFVGDSLAEFKEKDFDLAITLTETEHDKFKYRMMLKNGNLYKKLMSRTRFPDGTGQLVICKKSVFDKLGGYKDWAVAEDTDLFWRAAKQKFAVGVLNTRFHSSLRRFEKFGIIWIFIVWGIIGILMMLGIYKRSDSVRKGIESLYGSWGKWGR